MSGSKRGRAFAAKIFQDASSRKGVGGEPKPFPLEPTASPAARFDGAPDRLTAIQTAEMISVFTPSAVGGVARSRDRFDRSFRARRERGGNGPSSAGSGLSLSVEVKNGRLRFRARPPVPVRRQSRDRPKSFAMADGRRISVDPKRQSADCAQVLLELTGGAAFRSSMAGIVRTRCVFAKILHRPTWNITLRRASLKIDKLRLPSSPGPSSRPVSYRFRRRNPRKSFSRVMGTVVVKTARVRTIPPLDDRRLRHQSVRQHLRAVCGLPLGSTEISSTVSHGKLVRRSLDCRRTGLGGRARIEGVHLHLYERDSPDPGGRWAISPRSRRARKLRSKRLESARRPPRRTVKTEIISAVLNRREAIRAPSNVAAREAVGLPTETVYGLAADALL